MATNQIIQDGIMATQIKRPRTAFDPKAALDVFYAIDSKGIIVQQGFGLSSYLQTLSTDSSWYSALIKEA